jgi:hypothetical protein
MAEPPGGLQLCEQFFVSLQQSAKEWVFLGTTKSGIIYRLNGDLPRAYT